MNIKDRRMIDDRVNVAYNDFMQRLFGEDVPKNPQDREVDREKYVEAMHFVQTKYGLLQGDPDFMEWVLTLVGRSPRLTSEGAIVYDNQAEPVGEVPPSQAE